MARRKNFNRRMAIGGAAALALGGGYLGLRGPGRGHAVTPPGTLHRGNGAEPNTLDPSLFDSAWEDYIIGDLMVGLMTDDPAARPVPGVATAWQTSADGLTWTFTLRESLWSDGVPLTAHDFIFSWRRILDPKTAAYYAYFIYVIKNAAAINAGKLPGTALGARALDDRSLEIQLEHPAPYLLEMLTHPTLFAEPRHVVAVKGNRWTRPGTYVGNGPFMLTEWVPNDHITLVKNPRFFDAAKVALDKVVFYPTADYSAALRRLQAGELDTQDRLEAGEFGWIKKNMPELIDPVPQLILDLIVANIGRKPFDDIRVRTAINLAINREAITDKIRRAGDLPAYNLVPPNTANYPGGEELFFHAMPYPARYAMAQKLMREAGFGPDKRLKANYLIRSAAAGTYRAVAAALQQMFSLIYLDITITPSDAQIFYKTIQEHDFDLAQPGWSADFDDASNFLDLFRAGGGNDWGQYNDPAFDKMLDSAQGDPNLASRARKLAAAEAILLKNQALMPLFFWVSGNLVRPYIKGWVANNLDVHRSRWMSIDQKARAALFA